MSDSVVIYDFDDCVETEVRVYISNEKFCHLIASDHEDFVNVTIPVRDMDALCKAWQEYRASTLDILTKS